MSDAESSTASPVQAENQELTGGHTEDPQAQQVASILYGAQSRLLAVFADCSAAHAREIVDIEKHHECQRQEAVKTLKEALDQSENETKQLKLVVRKGRQRLGRAMDHWAQAKQAKVGAITLHPLAFRPSPLR
jgi:hypothetical protein